MSTPANSLSCVYSMNTKDNIVKMSGWTCLVGYYVSSLNTCSACTDNVIKNGKGTADLTEYL